MEAQSTTTGTDSSGGANRGRGFDFNVFASELNGTSVDGYSPLSTFTAANLATTYSPRFPRYGRLTSDQERLGVTGSLQFRPADRTLFTLDILYSDLKTTREEDWLEALSFARTRSQGGRPEIIVRSGQLSSTGDLVKGLFDSVDIESEMRIDDSETKFTQYNLGGEHEFNDRLKLTGLVGYSKSDFDLPISTNIILNREN